MQEGHTQEAELRRGTQLDISGHKANVIGILKNEVECQLQGRDEIFTVSFDKIEEALKRQQEEIKNVEEKARKTTKKENRSSKKETGKTTKEKGGRSSKKEKGQTTKEKGNGQKS